MFYRSAGLAIGITVGIIISVILLKFMNKDGRMRTKYDEMQEKARGKAYMYSFWTLAACETLVSLFADLEVNPFGNPFTANLTCVIIAALVHASYSIWNNAYMGLNNNYKRYTVCMILIGLVNLMCAIYGITSGYMIMDGVLQPSFTNLMCAVIFIAIAVELFIKNTRDAGREED